MCKEEKLMKSLGLICLVMWFVERCRLFYEISKLDVANPLYRNEESK